MSAFQNHIVAPLKSSIAIVFDDHQLFSYSFSVIIERLGLFQSVKTFSVEKELMNFLITNNKSNNYIFLDYYIQDKTSILMLNEIKRINKLSKIIMCSSVHSPAIIENILTYEPAGFISKSSDINILMECIKTVERGEQYLCPHTLESLSEYEKIEKITFTAREIDILGYFSKGLSIAETAEKTFLSKHTVVSHRRNMMAKVRCKSITELLAYARKNDLI